MLNWYSLEDELKQCLEIFWAWGGDEDVGITKGHSSSDRNAVGETNVQSRDRSMKEQTDFIVSCWVGVWG